MNNDATLLDTSRAPAATPSTTAAYGAARPTVLPRVERVDDAPALVANSNTERFEKARVLGRGGVGEVVLARDNDIDRPVAIKRLLPEFNDPGITARFVGEIRVLGTLDHPNIVPIHDVGIDPDGRFFYVMKYVEGETIETIIEKLAAGDRSYHQRYTFERRTEIFRQVLRAIQYAHARGIIHRDIKPANVMVGPFGEVLVMDWGLARRIHDDEVKFPVTDESDTLKARKGEQASPRARTMAGSLLGTPAYMSPEQARGEHDALDERSDVYALSVMFHEFLTLDHYLAKKDSITACIAGVLKDEVPFAATMSNPHQAVVPAELAHFVRHGVAKSPAERYRTVTAMLDRLQQIEEGHCPVECAATMMKRMSTETAHAIDRRPNTMLVVVMVSVILLLFGAVAAVFLVMS